MPMMDQEKLKRFLEVRQWLHVAAGACTWCAARMACVVVDKEAARAGEKPAPAPSWGCTQRQECELRANIFWLSKPTPGEELIRTWGADCPKCHSRAMVLLFRRLDGKREIGREVMVCQKCRREKIGGANGKQG